LTFYQCINNETSAGAYAVTIKNIMSMSNTPEERSCRCSEWI